MTDKVFGSSHTVFGADGAPIKVQEWTDDRCSRCLGDDGLGERMGILTESNGGTSLICPRCGEVVNVRSTQVQKVKL